MRLLLPSILEKGILIGLSGNEEVVFCLFVFLRNFEALYSDNYFRDLETRKLTESQWDRTQRNPEDPFKVTSMCF